MQTNVRQKVWVCTGGNPPRWDKPRGGCYRAGYHGRLSATFFLPPLISPLDKCSPGWLPISLIWWTIFPSNLTHISPEATTQDNTLITFVQCQSKLSSIHKTQGITGWAAVTSALTMLGPSFSFGYHVFWTSVAIWVTSWHPFRRIILQATAELPLNGRVCTCKFQSTAKTEFKPKEIDWGPVQKKKLFLI